MTLVADGHATGDRKGMTAEQVVAHHNDVLANLAHPDHSITVVPAREVRF